VGDEAAGHLGQLLGKLRGLGMHCPSCAKGSIIEIHMCVAGSDLTFRRCGRCEAQTWEAPEGFVPLTRVLELVRAT
jgi:hypothetical protein